MKEPGRLQSMRPLRVGHDLATSLSLFTFMHWRRKWQPTPEFLPGESQGRGSLVGGRLWGRTWLKWLSSSSSSKLKSHKSDMQLLNNIALWPRFYLPSSRRTRMSFLKFFCPTPSFFASPPYTKMVHFQNQEKSISTFLVCVLFIYFSAFRFFKIYVWCVF